MSTSGVIGAILPQAIGVAVSPVPIIAVILMLFSARARTNGLAFAAGWIGALVVVGSAVLLAADAGGMTASGTPSTASLVIQALLGLLFVMLSYRQWRSRPEAGEPGKMPAWMSSIDSFGPGKSFGIGALLAGVNPKNLGLTIAATLTIAEAGLTGYQEWAALAVFIVLASITVLVPVVFYSAAGDASAKTLAVWKAWLVANNATVMAVLFLVLGSALLGEGVGGLLG